MTILRRWRGAPWAGLVTGPAAWAINTQLGYALVPWICANESKLIPPIALGMTLVALAGAFVSWLSLPQSQLDSGGSPAGGEPRSMLAAIGVASGLLFALLILTQGAAGLVFHGCER